MSTGTTIVQKALQKIGAHSQIRKAGASSIEDGFEALMGMLQLWLSQGINIGFQPISTPGGEVGEPADTTLAIINNLALELAPDREGGKEVVSQTLRNNARRGYLLVKGLYQNLTIPDKVISSTVPMGQGNQRWLGERTFAGKGATLESTNS